MCFFFLNLQLQEVWCISFSHSGSLAGVKMNKQPSKESLKDRVKGIFGLGPPRPHSKQTESKLSEFIITLDILMVRNTPIIIHTIYTSPRPCVSHNILSFYRSGTHSRERPQPPDQSHQPRVRPRQIQEVWGGGEHPPAHLCDPGPQKQS